MRKKNIFIIAIASLLLLIGISFSTIILSKKKQNEVLKDYIIDINLISNVHPSLPWQFKSNHSEIKIKPGEVKVVEYEGFWKDIGSPWDLLTANEKEICNVNEKNEVS